MATKAKVTSSRTAWLDKHGLSDRQRDFVLFYLGDPNATKAAADAGYKNPKEMGTRQLSKVAVRAAIAEGRAKTETKTLMKAEEVVSMWATLATADASELTQNITAPCRYCNGLDHEFQWKTPREFKEAFIAKCYELYVDADLRDKALAGGITDERLPSDAGGYGYRVLDDPAPDCPECSGIGVEIVRMTDTRKLSPGARMLYDGVEVTNNGKKIRITSREAALTNLAKHYGMFAGKVEDEVTSPLSRLVQRLAESAAPVPVQQNTPVQQSPHPMDAHPNDPPQNQDEIGDIEP